MRWSYIARAKGTIAIWCSQVGKLKKVPEENEKDSNRLICMEVIKERVQNQELGWQQSGRNQEWTQKLSSETAGFSILSWTKSVNFWRASDTSTLLTSSLLTYSYFIFMSYCLTSRNCLMPIRVTKLCGVNCGSYQSSTTNIACYETVALSTFAFDWESFITSFHAHQKGLWCSHAFQFSRVGWKAINLFVMPHPSPFYVFPLWFSTIKTKKDGPGLSWQLFNSMYWPWWAHTSTSSMHS